MCDGARAAGAAPSVHRRGTASFITTPVDGGRALHLYDTALRLKGVSPRLPGGACASNIAALDGYTFVSAAESNEVFVFRNMRSTAVWLPGSAPVSHLLVVASFVVAVVAEERRVVVWRIPTSRKATTPQDGDVVANVVLPHDFFPTAVAHPPTYLNKLLLGAEDGRLLLLNLRSQNVVHVFPTFGCRINVLAPSPVLDVVAVGTSDGRIILHNIRVDETILTLRHGPDVLVGDESSDGGDASDDEGPCTKSEVQSAARDVAVCVLSFCTDGSETLISGDAVGNLAVWGLNEKALLAVARGVHPGGSSLAEFFPGEPLLVTAGTADNALKVHVFDGPTRAARVLRSREGHRLPPTRVRFSGRDAKMLVSAGLDRELRIVSAVRDAQNRSFSQAGLGKASTRVKKRRRANAGVEDGAQRQISDGARRLPVVTGIATSTARRRDKDFANVVTIHARRAEGYTWRLESGAVYRHVLRPPAPPEPLKLAFQRNRQAADAGGKDLSQSDPTDATSATQLKRGAVSAKSVVLSHCGNFAFLGLSNGELHSFNLQSGRHLGTYVADKAYREALTKPTKKLRSWGCAHSGPVTGLAVDACGDVLVSGDGSGELRFWNLRTREPMGSPVELAAGVSSLIWSKSSDLVAVVCHDFGVYVFDSSTHKLARRLHGHMGPVTDVSFDSEGRRVVTSSMDGTLKTWDLPSGRAIDTLVCETAPTSVAVAPGGEFIATCHVNSVSVALWVDQSKFGGAISSKPKSHILASGDTQDATKPVQLPGASTQVDYSLGSDCDELGQEDSTRNKVEESGDEGATGSNPGSIVGALASDLITLSGKATTHWTTLANLDAIKQRNKPLQPPKKPEAAPFFLPTVKGVKPKFDFQTSTTGENDERIAPEQGDTKGNSWLDSGESGKRDMEGDGDDFFGNSEFGSFVAARNFTAAFKLLASMGPSGVDVEIRTLEGARSRLGAGQYFTEQLRTRVGYEITQAQLDLFLKAHGIALAQDEGGIGVLQDLSEAQNQSWDKLMHAFDSVLTLSATFAGHV